MFAVGSGLDALEVGAGPGTSRIARIWAQIWPKAAAIGIVALVWQSVVWAHWRPSYLLPGPGPVLGQLGSLLTEETFWKAVRITLQRAAEGFGMAAVIGVLIGSAVTRSRHLRTAVGSLITGLQTMPSIVWLPLAVLILHLSEAAILFVVILGAAPSIANGLISGVDHVPPLYLRAGRVLGARGLALYRHVIFPAALPSFVGGLKQGWAFAWRSLMAGELLVLLPNHPSIGAELEYAQDFTEASTLMALMLVVLIIGILADTVFSRADLAVRKRWGLVADGS